MSTESAKDVEPEKEPKRSPLERARAVGHWLRDTGLGVLGYVVVGAVALSGWAASFLGLHDFGMNHMGLSDHAAWLVPMTFDGAPAGLSIVVMRASTHGRSAMIWRLLIVAFTGLSSWINYEHIEDDLGRWVASFMPPSAVALFEGLMDEARQAYRRLHGKTAPRLRLVRWLMDHKGTWAIYKAHVLGQELPEGLAAAQLELSADHADRADHDADSGTDQRTTDHGPASPATDQTAPAVPVQTAVHGPGPVTRSSGPADQSSGPVVPVHGPQDQRATDHAVPVRRTTVALDQAPKTVHATVPNEADQRTTDQDQTNGSAGQDAADQTDQIVIRSEADLREVEVRALDQLRTNRDPINRRSVANAVRELGGTVNNKRAGAISVWAKNGPDLHVVHPDRMDQTA